MFKSEQGEEINNAKTNEELSLDRIDRAFKLVVQNLDEELQKAKKELSEYKTMIKVVFEFKRLDNGNYCARCLPLGLTAYDETQLGAKEHLKQMFNKLLELHYKDYENNKKG